MSSGPRHDARLCSQCSPPGAAARAELDRRSFLRFSLGALASLTLPLDAVWGQEPIARHPAARACIVLWLEGGPSHIDTFDPKPGNGAFRAIGTRIPGVQISEHLPRMAERMDRIALVRSVSSTEGNHQRARYLARTGYAPNPTVAHPSLGAIVAKEIGRADAELPNFIAVGGTSEGAGFFGVQYSPFLVQSATRPIQNLEPPRGISTPRFNSRLALAQRLDAGFRARHPGRDVEAHETITARTVRFMHSELRAAFDLAGESQSTREAYGTGEFGSGVLMARRLIQAGVPFIEVSLGGWDTHQDNFGRVAALSAELDQALAALLDDLAQRELLDQTLVVTLGEFGRTPEINANEGRDHWPQAWSVAFAGANVRGGQVIGATDAQGADVVDGRVGVPDVIATVCASLGIDHAQWNMTPVGRPLQLTDHGAPIGGLLA